MAFKLATLFVDVIGRNSSAKTLDVVKSQLQGVGAAASGAGNIIRTALAAAGVAGIGAGIYKAVTAASDLNETLSKVGVVFGSAAKVVEDQANEMARSFGLGKQEMLDAASGIGLVGKAAGQSQAQAAAMANQMAKLAADASSFYNVPLEDALGTIKSALVGESEPIRKFGVLLNEAAVSAEAVRLGLSKTGKDLNEQAKVMARSSLIVKGMADATGDLGRTQDSTSNQLRKLTGSIGNLATDFGSVLLPVVNKVVNGLTAFTSSVTSGFESAKPSIESFVNGIVSGFDDIQYVFQNFGTYWTIASIRFTEGVLRIGDHLAVLPENLSRIGSYIAGNWQQLIRDAIAAVGKSFENLGKNIANLAAAIFKWMSDPLSDFEFNWKPLLTGFEATAAQLPEMMKPHLTSLQDLVDAEMAKLPKRAQKAAEGWAKSAPPKPGAAANAAAAAAVAGEKKFKPETMSLTEFARSLRAGGNDTPQARQLGEMVKANETQRKMLGELRKANKRNPVALAVFAK